MQSCQLRITLSLYVDGTLTNLLFLDREWEGERERNINVWLPLMYSLLGTKPIAQVSALMGIELVTLWFTGLHSIH